MENWWVGLWLIEWRVRDENFYGSRSKVSEVKFFIGKSELETFI